MQWMKSNGTWANEIFNQLHNSVENNQVYSLNPEELDELPEETKSIIEEGSHLQIF